MHSVVRELDDYGLPPAPIEALHFTFLLSGNRTNTAQCLQSTFTYMSPWVKYHAHFTDVEPEAQRG